MEGLYRFSRRLTIIFYSIFFRFKIEGTENIKADKNYIFCGNHISNHDPFVLVAALPIQVRVMGKKELFKYKGISWFLSKNGVFPVDRHINDLKAIKHALRILKKKESLLLFPEGTRNRTSKALPVKSGAAMLSSKTKTEILPVTIDSSYRIFSPIRVVFHASISLDSLGDGKIETDVLEKKSQEIMDQIYLNLKYYKK